MGRGKGKRHGLVFMSSPFPAFISWVLLSLPGHTGYAGFFWLYTLETTYSSSFFCLFDGQLETLRTPERDRTSDRKNLEGTPSFPPLLAPGDPTSVEKGKCSIHSGPSN